MVCFEYVKSGGWNAERKLFLHFENAVEYAVQDMKYRYVECLATYDEMTLKAYCINPDEIDEKLEKMREYLGRGDGFSGIQMEYYEIHELEIEE